jgi:RNA polymerase sigma-70 factor, ECF subfamily
VHHRLSEGEALAGEKSPLQEQALEVHRRLLQGDPTASLDATELLLNPLITRLRARWPTLDHDTNYDAATEVLVQYLQAPARYDPVKASVLGWLFMQAHGDLINGYRTKQKRFEQSWVVESGLPASQASGEPSRLDDYLPPTEMNPRLDSSRVLAAIREAFPDDRDRRLLWHVVVDGSQSTDEAAEILGLTHLAAAERTTEVRKNKDRIMKRLRRLDLDRDDD